MNIFLFHRDLRINDNTTLIYQSEKDKETIPIFIFTPEQILKKNNNYHSNNSVQFMIESLHELSVFIKDKNGKLYFFMGDTLDVLKSIHKEHSINSIAYNIDYTPYAIKRDTMVNKWCEDNNIKHYAQEDYVLYNIIEGETKNKTSDNGYLVFTPFKNHCMKKLKVRNINLFHSFKFTINNTLSKNKYYMKESEIDKFYTDNPDINVHGGRKNGLAILKKIDDWADYNKNRDYMEYKTTFLSAHNHFSTISIREVYHKILSKLGHKNNLINELHWRDFYMNIAYFYPKVLEGQIKNKNKPLKEKYEKTKWPFNKKLFTAWCEGTTGFPIVDACMTQLNTTGYMHNRGRMIVASFLCKDLLIDWRYGEKYFATKLVDYDPTANSGGWQWASSTGADSQPYFRIFNPWLQQEKFDKDCEYIFKWLPQLIDISNKDLHNWYKPEIHEQYLKLNINYVKPILDHDKQKKKALALYK